MHTKEAARTAIAAAAADHFYVVADVDSGLADAATIQALAIALLGCRRSRVGCSFVPAVGHKMIRFKFYDRLYK